MNHWTTKLKINLLSPEAYEQLRLSLMDVKEFQGLIFKHVEDPLGHYISVNSGVTDQQRIALDFYAAGFESAYVRFNRES